MECLRLLWSREMGLLLLRLKLAVSWTVFPDRTGAGQCSFSRVYKVFHLDHGRNYTMKLLKNSMRLICYCASTTYRSEPAVASQHRKDGVDARLAPPLVTPYILNEYVEGETLEPYCDGRKSLSWKDIQKIGLQILEALDALHPKTANSRVFGNRCKSVVSPQRSSRVPAVRRTDAERNTAS